MKIDLQKSGESMIIKLDDGEEVEFSEEDLESIGIDADKVVEAIRGELEKFPIN